jgi:uncharacterized membrane protein YagU involved in acid resistance
MNIGSWLLWGFVATTLLTSIMVGAQALGLTRMNITYFIGSMYTGDRDRAKVIGFANHLIDGWLFALIYVVAFQAWGRATWWLGALIGLVHVAFVGIVAMPIFPALHPRMASETTGPTVVRQLEPPGFFMLHYGRSTPLVAIFAHMVYGAVLGAFYVLPGQTRCWP